jgi:cytochrome c556
MKRFACLALLGLFVLSAAAADPTIKDIMKRAHMGNSSLLPEIGRDLKAATPDWAEVQKHVKELNVLGTALAKNTPPKGDRNSWDRFTQAYLADVKSLEDATQKKDRTTAQVALNKLNSSCKACHSEHQKK